MCEVPLRQSRNFRDSSCPHHTAPNREWNGKSYCLLHLPATAKQGAGWEQHGRFWREFDETLKATIERFGIPTDLLGKKLDLRGVIFPKQYSFSQTKGTTQLPSIDLSDSEFCGSVSFSNVNFRGLTYFSNCTFEADADFSQTQFTQAVYFEEVRWKTEVNFASSSFHGPAFFNSSKFRIALIERAEFLHLANFSSIQSSLRISFRTTIFENGAVFHKAKFLATDFEGTQFKQNVTFELAEFHIAPSFFLTRFDGSIILEKASFVHGAAGSYRYMKRLMEDYRDWREATRLFGYEMAAERRGMHWLAKWGFSLNFWYWALNDYGRDYRRGICWVIILLFLFSVVYFWMGNIRATNEWRYQLIDISEYGKALIFSLQNVVFPFIFRKALPVEINSLAGWVISIIHSAVNILLIAMIVLSIRRRFKI